jgi:murein DD-endopeptidase MepM/ murein hydrolase activator NlpD
VRATSDGGVSAAGWAGGYGLRIALDHGNAVETRYAHLSQLAVRPGQQVRQGEVIGFVGSTGQSTGPHVHYELRRGGLAIDPLAR